MALDFRFTQQFRREPLATLHLRQLKARSAKRNFTHVLLDDQYGHARGVKFMWTGLRDASRRQMD
jgi:hypothetical protein